MRVYRQLDVVSSAWIAVSIPLALLLAGCGNGSTSVSATTPGGSIANRLTLNGNAAITNGKLRITPFGSFTSGSAWSQQKQLVAHGFTTSFQFQITGTNTTKGDGLAFVIQNAGQNALGSSGEGIGYGNTYSSPISNSLVIEFDDYQNSDDPAENHVSIHTRGMDGNSERESYSIGRALFPAMTDGKPHGVSITYTPGTLAVYVDNSSTPLISVPYTFENGGKYLASGNVAPGLSLDNGSAWVGFTASTGTAKANYDVFNWDFNSIP